MPALDVRPDAFVEAAQTVIGDAAGTAHAAALRMISVLDGCGSMAGSDPPARTWASSYDEAAASAVRATGQLLDATVHVGLLLEQTGVNHARAEAASTAGSRAALPVLRHEPGWRATLGLPPSAAGGESDAPAGWALVQHLVGYVWPSGRQGELHRAADAWVAGADGLDRAAGQLPAAAAVIATVTSPEVDDAAAVVVALRTHYLELARSYRGLAHGCRDLAHHIDTARSAAEHELVEMMAFIGGAEVVGGLLSLCTFGAAELPTQAAVAVRVAAAGRAVETILSTLRTTVQVLAAELLPFGELADSLVAVSAQLQRVRPVIAGAEQAAVIGGEMRMAKVAASVRTEVAAERRLAAAATRTVEKANSPVWKNLKPHKGRIRTNGAPGKRRRFYDWDHTHHDIEVYDKDGWHLGSMDPTDGRMTKPREKGRRIHGL